MGVPAQRVRGGLVKKKKARVEGVGVVECGGQGEGLGGEDAPVQKQPPPPLAGELKSWAAGWDYFCACVCECVCECRSSSKYCHALLQSSKSQTGNCSMLPLMLSSPRGGEQAVHIMIINTHRAKVATKTVGEFEKKPFCK